MEPARGFLNEELLRSLLERDRAKGVAASRGGKINRKHYAKLLGCHSSALTRFKPVFTEYEKELGIKTGPMRHLDAMRTWLTEAFESKALDYTAGKLDRLQFQLNFKLRGGVFLTKYPEIRRLFDEFDARASKENYLPAIRLDELARLKVGLAGQPPLNKDRVSINRPAISEATGIPESRFREIALLDLIEAKEAEILENAKASKVDPYFHNRVYAFSLLSHAWPIPFLEKIGIQFKVGFSGKGTHSTKHAYLQLYKLLSWLNTRRSPKCTRVAAEIRTQSKVVSDADWEETLHEYRDHLLSSLGTNRAQRVTVDRTLQELRSALNMFAGSRIFPELSVPLPGVKLSKVHSQHLRSVAEVVVENGTSRSTEYIKFASNQLRLSCEKYGLHSEVGDGKDFLASLAAEAERGANLPADPAEGIKLLLERRLDALRCRAISVLHSAVDAYELGRDLLAVADIDGETFENSYFRLRPKDWNRGQLLREHFPIPSSTNEARTSKGLANLLGFIEQRFAGIPPNGGSNKQGPYGQFFGKRYLEHGGISTIESLLFPDRDAVGAVLTLYLLESGANVGVGRTLNQDCAETSDLAGFVRITGHKARAQGKPIIVDLPEQSEAVRGIQWLLRTGERLRANCQDDSDRLFLMKIGDRIQLATSHWYTNWFKAFAANTSGLEGLSLTPNMLRPSVLLQAALNNDGRLAVGMAIGQHGTTVSQGYQKKFPTRLLYDNHMRHFQSAFEILVVSSIQDAASNLGISEAEFDARLQALRPTGLGTFCKDSRGRAGKPGTTCKTIDCWNECPHLQIIAEVEAIAVLQIWQVSLRAAQPDWERDRPERWDEVWLPWLCLTDVVAEKMARGPLIKIWNAASAKAAEMSAHPNFVQPKPW
ncbi:MAG: hypothetical protein CFE43_01935 [Burkholderiales bacterium PBB3]|nr:MAG: hypothetical protein CFE43_01935 [Burkholderiales bacterium PBB3]